MHASDIYWPYVALATGTVATVPFLYFLTLRRWTWIGLIAGIANLFVVFLNGAAPIRGLLDPNYVGYAFGMMSAEKGLEVAIMAGMLVVASTIAAWDAVRNRPGFFGMISVAGMSALHVVNLGFPMLDTIRSDPAQMTIQFGEYLTVPYLVAIPALLALIVLPFLLALPWSLQRMMESD
jgi:hypothetical protein